MYPNTEPDFKHKLIIRKARKTAIKHPSSIGQKKAGIISLSVIIPTYNAARTIKATITALDTAEKAGISLELIVVDANSTDETACLAKKLGARVIYCEKGRGPQLIAGSKAAKGDWLLFLHADTVLGAGWAASIVVFASQKSSLDRAAVFTFALDTKSRASERLTQMVRFRNKWLGLPYGDQGLLIYRRFYKRTGGYKPWPLMEDVDLVRRIGNSKIALFDTVAITSAERYVNDGYLKRITRNFLCLFLYFIGVSPKLISKIYNTTNT